MAGAPATNDARGAALARNWWLVALRGVLAILFGIVAILLPGPTLAALVLLFAAYMVVDGVLAIVAAVRAARRHERWGWLIFEGIVDLAAAAIAFLFPVATIFAFVLPWWIGAYALIFGVALLVLAFRLRRRAHEAPPAGALPHGV